MASENDQNLIHTKTINKLKIIAVNVNSIITNQRRASLMDMTKKENPDLILLGETKISAFHKIQFANYNFIRRDRPNATQGGGTAIMIKREWKYKEIQLVFQKNATTLEVTIIQLNLSGGDKLFIISAYSAGNNSKDFSTEWNQIFQELKLDEYQNYYILAGDLNAKHSKWQNAVNNPRGIFLHDWLTQNSIIYKTKMYSTELPSYPRGNSFLDLCFTDCRLEVETIGENYLNTIHYDSDHNAIQMNVTLSGDRSLQLETQVEEHQLNFRSTDWVRFKDRMRERNNYKLPYNRNLSNDEIDEHLKALDEIIKHTISEIVPRIKPKNNTDSYMNDRIKTLQKQKSKLLTQLNKMYRQFQTHDTFRLNSLKQQLKKTKETLKLEFKVSINNYWRQKIEKISAKDPKNMFPQVNQIFRPRKKADIPDLVIEQNKRNLLTETNIDASKLRKNTTGEYIISDASHKLDIIGAHFANTHTQNANLGREQLTRIVTRETDKLKKEITEDRDNLRTVTTFSQDNPAHNPKNDENVFFISYTSLKKIMRL